MNLIRLSLLGNKISMNPNPDTKDCENPWVYFRKRFICSVCGVRFKERWLLQRHVKSGVCLTKRKVRGPGKQKADVSMQPSILQSRTQKYEMSKRPLASKAGETDIDIRLPYNFKLYIAGPARSGKTTICHKLLQNLSDISRVEIRKTVWVYRQWQPIYDQMQTESLIDEFIECNEQTEGTLRSKIDEYIDEDIPFLLILDDCMHASKKVQEWIAQLFTTDARHKQMSVVYIRQKFFGDSEFVREIDRNADVIVLTENRREQGKICNQLAAQMGSTKARDLNDICSDATKRRENRDVGGYLWINLSNEIDSRFMYMTNVLEDQGHLVLTYDMLPGGGYRKMILLSKIKFNDLQAAADAKEPQDKSLVENQNESLMESESMDYDDRTLARKRKHEEDVDDPEPQRPRTSTPELPLVESESPTIVPPVTPSRPITPPGPPSPPVSTKRPREVDDNVSSTPKRLRVEPVKRLREDDDDDDDDDNVTSMSKRPRVNMPRSRVTVKRPRDEDIPMMSDAKRSRVTKKRNKVGPTRVRVGRAAAAEAMSKLKKCQLCGEEFESENKLLKHLKIHEEGY